MENWRAENLLSCDGILVGSDQSQEWLLPWWWNHYSRHNSHPVAFVDFGLAPAMRAWCEARGELIRLRADWFVKDFDEVAPNLRQEWQENFGNYCWESRSAWFKKPLACLSSPFKRTIWLDLDCEVRCPLEPLFPLADHPSGLCLAKDMIDPRVYNSGVLIFQRGIKLFEEWAQAALEQNHLFPGDQDILTHLLHNFPVAELSSLYNWSRRTEENSDAKILHWHGPQGKAFIRHQLWTASLTKTALSALETSEPSAPTGPP